MDKDRLRTSKARLEASLDLINAGAKVTVDKFIVTELLEILDSFSESEPISKSQYRRYKVMGEIESNKEMVLRTWDEFAIKNANNPDGDFRSWVKENL